MMRLRLPQSPIVRLALVTTLLTCGLLLMSDLLGLFPQHRQVMLAARRTVAESIAVQTVAAVRSDTVATLPETFATLIARTPAVRSIALRRGDGDIVASAGPHARYWTLQRGAASTETLVRVPILRDEARWGNLEIAFDPIAQDAAPGGLPRSLLTVLGFVAVAGFIAYLVLLRRALSELDPSAVIPQRVRNALDALAEGLVVVDAEGRIMLANRAFTTRLGVPAERLLGNALDGLEWLPPDGEGPAAPPWAAVLAGRASEAQGQLRIATADRQRFTFAVNAAVVTAGDGSPRGAFITFDDLTAVEQTNDELRRTLQKVEVMQRDLARQNQELLVLATRDSLSGVLNRRALFEAFDNLLTQANQQGGEVSCLMVDIDRFKSINDRYGHGVGDKVIKMVAGALNDTARATDLVGRYGGEEFCVLLPDTPLEEAREVAERIRRAIQDGVGVKFSTPMTVTASFGVSSTRFGATAPLDLCNQADRALYVAKESGRNRVVTWPEASAYAAETPAVVAEPPATAAAAPSAPPAGNEDAALRDRIAALERALTDSERARAGALMKVDASASAWPLLQDRIDQALRRTRRVGTHISVMALVLDRLDTVNAALGQSYVDRLIGAFHQRLHEHLRGVDTVSYLQGEEPGVVLVQLAHDEFVVVLTDLKQATDVSRIAERIVELARNPFVLDGNEIYVTARFGIAVAPGDGDDAQALVANANAALRHLRQHPDEPYRYFSPHMNALAVARLRAESDLRHAVERGEFVLHYQPRIDVRSGAITGLEALVRWQHPQQGLVFPDRFIPLAEEIGLIGAIGDWVIDAACRQLRQWQSTHLSTLEMAINVSPLQLRDAGFPARLQSLAAAAGVEPGRIELEITESVVIGNVDKVVSMLQELSAAGFLSALDDFGAGYSALGYLRALPVHRLKIDRSFLAGLGENLTDYSIVSSVIELAHSLGKRVVAEGVEAEAQWEALRELGCDEVQGYFFSRPVVAATVDELLARGSPFQRKLRLIHHSDQPRFASSRPVIKGVLNEASDPAVAARMRERLGAPTGG